MKNKQKLLIADDSALIRKYMAEIFSTEAGFELIFAKNGQEAVDLNMVERPDVISLDVNMPGMDGLTALAQIMSSRPVPVVMFSSQTSKNAMATLEALALGAVDYLAKPQAVTPESMAMIRGEIIAKLKAALSAKPQRKRVSPWKERDASLDTLHALDRGKQTSTTSNTGRSQQRMHPTQQSHEGLVVIGASTGGPGVIEEIISAIPADFSLPVVVVQHMPASFTTAFAQRLDQICPLHVIEVVCMTELQVGHIYIAQGGHDAEIVRRFGKLCMTPRAEDAHHIWHPSVDYLTASLLKVLPAKQIIAVLLTGMGNDGAITFAQIHQQGGMTIAQSETSCVVFGMPRELIALGGASSVLDPEKIKGKVIHAARRLQRSYQVSVREEGRS